MAELIYKELSYKINGLCFEAQNKLGTKFQEKHYLKALCTLFKREGISYQTEVELSVKFEGEQLGKLRADLVIDNKILIELKAVDYLTSDHKQQLIRYLDSLNLKLALLINFRKRPLQVWRVLPSRVH
jgi:GxxExxY protein